jgi:thiol-disulfide isomerase/thioredoxin
MKHLIKASTLALSLAIAAGTPALAGGPEHKHDHDAADAMKAKAEPKLEDFVGEIAMPELYIGSKAPELQIAKFVKGDSVGDFEEGQVYVVEFWATWCGPCIKAFPHLSKLQEEHGENVQFIGVNVWEGVEDQTERMEKIEAFVEKQGDRMSYTVAVEDGSAMADTWMKPAGQNGIPAAFIVDGTGSIAWIGHPAAIDEPLAGVIAGDFDSTAARKEAMDGAMMMAGYNKFREYMASGDNIDDARQIANLLIDNYGHDEPGFLNAISWTMLNAESEDIGKDEYNVALRAISIACEKTQWKDWSLLDTYALAQHKVGNNKLAAKWQKKAVDLTPAENKEALDELTKRLKEYEELDS